MTKRIDPATDRIVPASPQHAGMTQIIRGGRSYQVAGVGPEATAMLDHHAACIASGEAIPDYGSRWPAETVTGDALTGADPHPTGATAAGNAGGNDVDRSAGRANIDPISQKTGRGGGKPCGQERSSAAAPDRSTGRVR